MESTVALIEELSVDWDPERYEDRYRARLDGRSSRRKRKGGTVKAPEPEKEPAAAPDLMAALEESLDAARGGGTTPPEDRTSRDDGGKLAQMTKDELMEQAREADLSGRSKMTKDQLVAALSG